MATLCRDCLDYLDTTSPTRRCTGCGSPRLTIHPELFRLAIAHIDCDAFYASVEKRDNPDLADRPVIIGGGRRGVVSTACYVARIRGVHSAMPMFKALGLCPDAVVIPPRMSHYTAISRQIRAMMERLTPAVEPLSLDEAFLDLSGTERLHGAPPAVMLARLARQVRSELGLTVSIGLSHNKFLAKVASDLDKPQGFAVIGQMETADFLRDRPVGLIWGIGDSAQKALEQAGIRTFSDLLRWKRPDLVHRFGAMGDRLWHLARGEDLRKVIAFAPAKSLSNETTFAEDTNDPGILDGHLWRLCEKVSGRAKAKGLVGRVVTLKLKRANHGILTRRATLRQPTQSADRIYRTCRGLFDRVAGKEPYRLLGCGIADLTAIAPENTEGDLLDPLTTRRAQAERATDDIRKRYGAAAIVKGRSLR